METEASWTRAGAVAALAAALLLAGGSARADKPSWAGRGQQAEVRPAARVTVQLGERERAVIRAYFAHEGRMGHCPPGLARKNNGCLPPGQAKKWRLGRPLPRDVVVHDLPPRLVVDLGAPPAGHRFVRVAADILLIAVGTGMVIDAVQDIAATLER